MEKRRFTIIDGRGYSLRFIMTGTADELVEFAKSLRENSDLAIIRVDLID